MDRINNRLDRINNGLAFLLFLTLALLILLIVILSVLFFSLRCNDIFVKRVIPMRTLFHKWWIKLFHGYNSDNLIVLAFFTILQLQLLEFIHTLLISRLIRWVFDL